MQRVDNTLPNSPFQTILVYPTGSFGTGARILVQYNGSAMLEFPRHHLAQFLNEATGKTPLLTRSISIETETQVVTALQGDLVLNHDKYQYIGPDI